SWATALVKILTENKIPTYWYLRRKEQVNHVKENGNNPSYLPQVQLNPIFVFPSGNLRHVVAQSRIIIFAVPSATLTQDRKSTRLNSSHVKISYAVFCS